MQKFVGALVTASILAAVVSTSAPALAQVTALAIGPNFQPDPLVFQGVAGGPVAANNVNNQCRGYIPLLPQHTLVLQSPMPFLRFLVAGDGQDGTLVVRGPGGMWCADDVNGSIDPIIDLTGLVAGRYDIFVGTYGQGNSFPYRFGVTESRAVGPTAIPTPNVNGGAPPVPPGPNGNVPPVPPPGGNPRGGGALQSAGLNPDAAPAIGRITLNGPLSAPRRERGHGGGGVDGSSVRGEGPCRGFFTAEPSMVLDVRRAIPLLRLWVNSGADTTLIVQGPDGVIRCADDEGGNSIPLLDFNRVATGNYRVWVGTYRAGMTGPFQVTMVSNPSLRP